MRPTPKHERDTGRSPSLTPFRATLRLLALAVPRGRRAEWAAEWSSELWYVRESLRSRDAAAPLALLAFCRGALADAWTLHCMEPSAGYKSVVAQGQAAALEPARSPLVCLAALLLPLTIATGLAIWLPGVQHVRQLATLRTDAGVVRIWPAASDDSAAAPLALGTVRSWQHRSQHLFRDFAFFAVRAKTLHGGAHASPELRVAFASANLPEMLGARIEHAAAPAPNETLPRLLLSESTWRARFGGRADIFGSAVRVGLQPARIAGVLPDGANLTDSAVDVWLLLPPAMAEALPDSLRVVAFGRAGAPTGFPDRRWNLSVAGPHGAADYTCVALAERAPEFGRSFLFALFLALLCVPATNFSLAGRGGATTLALAATVRLRRACFLVAKLSLLLPATYFASLDLAFCRTWAAGSTPVYLQMLLSFAGGLAALHWSLRDGRARCPVCLRTLRCPARVGQPSRNFLDWNGTELLCTGGHGLLHVPELPTSWFNRPCWRPLDPSWSSLFLRTT